MSPEETAARVDLSVVIPAFNSAPWLPSTLEALERCLARAPGLSAEIVVVDDGSTDATQAVVRDIAAGYSHEIRIIWHENSGRFISRWAGANAARGQSVLLLDSRVLIHDEALAFHLADTPTVAVRNAHVVLDTMTPLVGLFWEVPTRVFWGGYLADPRPTTVTPQNFDRVPKGTTCFLLPTALLIESCVATWPTGDPRLTSDDTRLLRHIAGTVPIRLDPRFAVTYRPRTSFRAFLHHSFIRGSLFVDSYWETSAARRLVLIALSAAPPLVIGALVAMVAARAWQGILATVAGGVLALAVPAAIAAVRRCSARALAAYFALILPFGVVFWAGLVRGIMSQRKAPAAQRAAQGVDD